MTATTNKRSSYRLLRFVEGNAFVLLLVVAVALIRLFPHLPNIAPVGALALFSGAYLRRRWFYLVPMAALLASDWVIGFYHAGVMAAVYAGFLVSALIGRGLLQGRDGAGRICGTIGAGALAFWLISNFGVWLFHHPKTLAGLWQCYLDAVPFLGRSLLGDAMYAALLFGGYKLARHAAASRTQGVPTTA